MRSEAGRLMTSIILLRGFLKVNLVMITSSGVCGHSIIEPCLVLIDFYYFCGWSCNNNGCFCFLFHFFNFFCLCQHFFCRSQDDTTPFVTSPSKASPPAVFFLLIYILCYHSIPSHFSTALSPCSIRLHYFLLTSLLPALSAYAQLLYLSLLTLFISFSLLILLTLLISFSLLILLRLLISFSLLILLTLLISFSLLL